VEVGPWDLLPSVTTWGAPSEYTTSTSGQSFRWISDTAHSTIVSTNYCYDYSTYYANTFPAHSTSYQQDGPPWENGLGTATAAAPTGDAIAVSEALALAQAPNTSAEMMETVHTAVADLEATGARLEQDVPLPAGDSFNINWDAAAAQGGDNESGMRGVILFQASCKWFQYAMSSGVTQTVASVLGSIPNWPSFRDQPYSQSLAAVGESITSGDATAARSYVALNCVER
jgi:hypothetical protein